MSWLWLVIISNFLFAIVFALDKILVKRFLSPLQYAAAVGLLEGFAVVLIPFVDFQIPRSATIIMAFFGGACFILGIYFFFKALLKYEVSWVSPLLYGVVVPIISLVVNYFFLGERLGFGEILAFVFLIAGGLIMSFSGRYSSAPFFFILASSFFISFYFFFLKSVFNEVNFLTGYIWTHFGAFLVSLIIFLFNRQIVKPITANVYSFAPLLLFKQALAFGANLMLTYAVSLASPTLINGANGVRYAFLLLITIPLSVKWPQFLDESLRPSVIIKKAIAVIFIIVGTSFLFVEQYKGAGVETWGVTYSSLYAKQLGLDPQEVFLSIINDLKVRDFRLIAYWPEIEPLENNYDFSDLDFQINALEAAGGKAILAVGLRLPRWPECHIPSWAREIKNSELRIKNDEIDNSLLKYIEATINRYKDSPSIWAWQVENEPFLRGFGECPKFDAAFLDKEIALVKSLDNRPIIITDSGELGLWHKAYRRADTFGTTMYLKIWNKFIPDGYFTYPLGPSFFQFKAGLMKQLFGEKKIINIELQAEPWGPKQNYESSLKEQFKSMNLQQFYDNIEYAKAVGFSEVYLWGAEWWYWMKEKQNHPEFWESAKSVISQYENTRR